MAFVLPIGCSVPLPPVPHAAHRESADNDNTHNRWDRLIFHSPLSDYFRHLTIASTAPPVYKGRSAAPLEVSGGRRNDPVIRESASATFNSPNSLHRRPTT